MSHSRGGTNPYFTYHSEEYDQVPKKGRVSALSKNRVPTETGRVSAINANISF